MRSRVSLMAAMTIAAAALPPEAFARPTESRPSPQEEASGEKMSRQRKRWLERQARKQQRKHKTTRR